MGERPATDRLSRCSPGLKAPRLARPLWAPALTPAARREDVAVVAGISSRDRVVVKGRRPGTGRG